MEPGHGRPDRHQTRAGSSADGWQATVSADIEPRAGAPDRAEVLVRVTTTFSRAGEENQAGSAR